MNHRNHHISRFRFSLFCILVVAFIQALAPTTLIVQADESDSGWVSMFDGKSLNGWEVMPAKAKAAWSANKGKIVGEGDKGRSYITYKERDVANFEMKLSYRFPGKGNSGVSIRAVVDETGKRDFKSYHADFGQLGIGKQVLGAWDFHTPGRTEHRCFRGDRLVIAEDDKPTITAIKDALTADDIHEHGWNAVHIIAKDNNFKLLINGKLSSEFTELLAADKRLHSGMIQLQLHDPGMIVEFKDLKIKID
ncbi:MAG: DUF1080 domain-containing protein [Planctomycetota bacterium]